MYYNDSWLYKKNVDTHPESFRKKTSNKNVIAKKPLTNLYEMNSSPSYSAIVEPIRRR